MAAAAGRGFCPKLAGTVIWVVCRTRWIRLKNALRLRRVYTVNTVESVSFVKEREGQTLSPRSATNGCNGW